MKKAFLKPTKTSLMILMMLVTLATSCKKSSEEPEDENKGGKPWLTTVMMGNFAINSVDLVTNEDGKSVDYLTDYIDAAGLPASNFTHLSMNAYIPTETGYSTTISGVNVQMHNTSNASSGNIYYDSDSRFVQQITLGGQLYSVYRIAASYNGSRGAFNRTSFANVVFSAQVVYEDENDQQVGSRTVKLEVYKR